MHNKLHIKRGNRVFLNDKELHRVIKVSVTMEAVRDPVIELQISADEITIDGYTNGIEAFNFPSQSNT